VTRAEAPSVRDISIAADVAAAAQLACLLEASAPKPGNVSPRRHFADARYEDFLASAVALGEPLAGVGTRPIGTTIRLAVEATARWTRSNTNLGIVLLLTPLARAAVEKGGASPFRRDAGKAPDALSVRRVLEATTVDDAREVYQAIRLAAPGGLGRVGSQDVAADPTMTLLDVMKLAASRDGIAREYATSFEVTFDIGAPALQRARSAGLNWDDAVVETFLTLLGGQPDTHIARRGGDALALEISRRAAAALAAGGMRSAAGCRAVEELDRSLRGSDNTANPGTTADLTAAAIFVVLLGGGWTSEG
jgi:triphosphoribosyl-dephospho-CoA synthase